MARRIVKITEIANVPSELVSDEDYTLLVDKESGVTKTVKLSQVAAYISGSGFNDVTIGTGSFTIVSSSILIGDGTEITNLRIGEPEDETFTDGLFVDFNNQTTVGTAIDRVNEVLKGLAPKPAPELLNIQTSFVGVPMKLSFGETSGVANYTNVTASFLNNSDINDVFAPSDLKRLGCFSQASDILITLNDTTQIDQLAAVNYPDDAFNVDRYGTGSYILEVNGLQQTADEISNTSSLQGTYFNLSEAKVAKFIGTGIEFDLFRHRSGSVTVPASLWREGHNYAKVISSSSL